MQIKMVKITKSFLRQNIYFCDFLLEEMGLVIKGIVFNAQKKTICFPLIKTEAGQAYSAFTLPDSKKYEDFKKVLMEVILEQPLPTYEEGAEERVKAAILLKKHERMKMIEEREKRRGQKKNFFPHKKTYQKFDSGSKDPRILSSTSYTPSSSKPRPPGMGMRFTEVSLPAPKRKPY